MDSFVSEKMDFKKIAFGKADAINEEDLLVDGFLDAEGYIEQIIDGEKYFIIGQKGSGKSAIATRLKIISETEKKIQTLVQMLDEFDYDGFGGVIPGKDTPEIQYNNTWEFLLSIKLIELYTQSKYEVFTKEADPQDIVHALKRLGILPNDLKSLIYTFKNKEFKIDAKIAEFTSSDRKLENDDIRKLIKSVTSYVYQIKPLKKHFIVLDGLDSVLGKREKQYSILASLIRTANLMNHKFNEKGIGTRVVILCRKDVLEKLNDPNRSKYIQDSGIELNWYQSVNVKDTNLYKLINLRASNSLKQKVDVMDSFFPPEFNGRETFRYLLDNTRYTPRDLIQLMNRIQSMSTCKGATAQSMKDGVNSYSEGYYLMEIKDSMVGMIPNEDIEIAFQTLRTLGKVEFTFQEYESELPDKSKALSLLNALYVAGAIGNVDKSEKGEAFHTTKVRNPNSIFNEKKSISVNSGLKKALMLHR